MLEYGHESEDAIIYSKNIMKLYNLKNLVVVSINGKKIICHKKEGELFLTESLTDGLMFFDNQLAMVPLQKKFCFSNANQFCILNKEQLIKYYLRLNQLTEESISELTILIRQALEEYYREYEISSSLEARADIKKELEKTCSTCVNATCRVPNVEKSSDESDNCLGWYNPTLVGKEMVRKRVQTKHNTPNATKI